MNGTLPKTIRYEVVDVETGEGDVDSVHGAKVIIHTKQNLWRICHGSEGGVQGTKKRRGDEGRGWKVN